MAFIVQLSVPKKYTLMTEKQLHTRLSEEEWEILELYCNQVRRTKSDVLREFVRSLAKKLK